VKLIKNADKQIIANLHEMFISRYTSVGIAWRTQIFIKKFSEYRELRIFWYLVKFCCCATI